MKGTAQENQAQLSVISWNINGLKEKLKDHRKKEQLLNIFGKYDIVLLQETHLGKKNKNKKVAKATKLREEKKLTETALHSENKNEDEEEVSAESEEKTVDSENQDEQSVLGIDSEDEDEDKEEMSAESEEKTVDSEKQDEQIDDDIIDSENKDEEKVSTFFKNSGYIEEVLQNQKCINPRISVGRTIYLTKFSSNSKGVAILVNKQHKCLKAFCDGGDYAWVYVEIDNKFYTFVSVYNHPKEKSNLMLRIICSFVKQESKACEWPVIGGDFNTTLNHKLDKDSTTDSKDSKEHKAHRKKILEIMEMTELKDVWREKHPNKKRFTYKTSKSRLDYVFMFQKHMSCVQNCDIRLDIDMVSELSDHYPVSLTLKIKN